MAQPPPAGVPNRVSPAAALIGRARAGGHAPGGEGVHVGRASPLCSLALASVRSAAAPGSSGVGGPGASAGGRPVGLWRPRPRSFAPPPPTPARRAPFHGADRFVSSFPLSALVTCRVRRPHLGEVPARPSSDAAGELEPSGSGSSPGTLAHL